jgi:hypothetical protein
MKTVSGLVLVVMGLMASAADARPMFQCGGGNICAVADAKVPAGLKVHSGRTVRNLNVAKASKT